MPNNISISDTFKEAIKIITTNKAYIAKVYLLAGLMITPLIIGFIVAISINFKSIYSMSVLEKLDVSIFYNMWPLYLGFIIAILFVMYIVNIGLLRIQLALIDGEKLPLSTLYNSHKMIVRVAKINIFTGFVTMLGFIALILPGVYILLRLYFSYIAAIDPKVTVSTKEVVRNTWNSSKGRMTIVGRFLFASFVISVVTSLPSKILSFVAGSTGSIEMLGIVSAITSVLETLVSYIVGIVTSFAAVVLYRKLQNLPVAGNSLNENSGMGVNKNVEMNATPTVGNIIASQEKINKPQE